MTRFKLTLAAALTGAVALVTVAAGPATEAAEPTVAKVGPFGCC